MKRAGAAVVNRPAPSATSEMPFCACMREV